MGVLLWVFIRSLSSSFLLDLGPRATRPSEEQATMYRPFRPRPRIGWALSLGVFSAVLQTATCLWALVERIFVRLSLKPPAPGDGTRPHRQRDPDGEIRLGLA